MPHATLARGGLGDGAHLLVIGYDRFKMVNQGLHRWVTLPNPPLEGVYVEHTFPRFASGAFGEESPGNWQTFDEVVSTLACVHQIQRASRNIIPGYFDYHARLANSKDQWV